MMQKWIGAFVAVVVASSVACKKDLHTSSVAAVLPGDVASKYSREQLAFIEVLPADLAGFGYVEMGMSVDQMIPAGTDYRGAVDDLVEMAQRRWGIEVRNVHGFGIAAQGDEPVLFAELGKAAVVPVSDPDFSTGRLGDLTLLGKPAAVAAMLASVKRGPALIKARPEWVKRALGHAAGAAAFYSFAGDKLLATADADDRVMLENIDDGTVLAGGAELAVRFTVKPGKMAAARAPVDLGLAEAREEMGAEIAKMPMVGTAVVAAILARHYGQALLGGVQISEQGDTLSVSLPWRAPSMPATSPAPSLSERVVVRDEWAVLQLDLGAPALQTLLALTDVIGMPLDRAKLGGELLAELSKALDVPAIDPRTATVSLGGLAGVVSLHTAKGALPKGLFPISKGEAVAAATPWGVAVTIESRSSTLTDALAKPSAGLPMAAQSKLAGNNQAILRAFVDFDRLPMMARAVVGSVPVRSAEISLTHDLLEATVVAKPGQAGQIQGLAGMAQGLVAGDSEQKYRDRKSASAEQEAEAIVRYHTAKMLSQMLTPKVDGDRLTFSYKLALMQLPPRALAAMLSASSVAGALFLY
jgi:hypothetical protein